MNKRFISFVLVVCMSLSLSPLQASYNQYRRERDKTDAFFYGIALMILAGGFGISGMRQFLINARPSVTFTSHKLKMHTGEEIPWNKVLIVSIAQEYLSQYGNVRYCIITLSPSAQSLINKNKERAFPLNKRDNELYVMAFDIDKPLEEFVESIDRFKKANAQEKKDPAIKSLRPIQFCYGYLTPTWRLFLGAFFCLGFGGALLKIAQS